MIVISVKKCNMICKFLIYSMLSCDGCSTGYKIYNQKIRLKTFFCIFAED